LISNCVRHTGPVCGLDFNSFQAHLLASGGNDGEVRFLKIPQVAHQKDTYLGFE
jgi:hypothetical protein